MDFTQLRNWKMELRSCSQTAEVGMYLWERISPYNTTLCKERQRLLEMNFLHSCANASSYPTVKQSWLRWFQSQKARCMYPAYFSNHPLCYTEFSLIETIMCIYSATNVCEIKIWPFPCAKFHIWINMRFYTPTTPWEIFAALILYHLHSSYVSTENISKEIDMHLEMKSPLLYRL